MLTLRDYVKIIVPSTNKDKTISNIEFNDRIQNISRYLSSLFGGTTVTNGIGHWLDNDNNLISEDVAIVQSWSNDIRSKQQNIIDKCQTLLHEFDQYSIALELSIDNDQTFYIIE